MKNKRYTNIRNTKKRNTKRKHTNVRNTKRRSNNVRYTKRRNTNVKNTNVRKLSGGLESSQDYYSKFLKEYLSLEHIDINKSLELKLNEYLKKYLSLELDVDDIDSPKPISKFQKYLKEKMSKERIKKTIKYCIHLFLKLYPHTYFVDIVGGGIFDKIKKFFQKDKKKYSFKNKSKPEENSNPEQDYMNVNDGFFCENKLKHESMKNTGMVGELVDEVKEKLNEDSGFKKKLQKIQRKEDDYLQKEDDYFHSTKRSVDEYFRKALYISLQDKIFNAGILDSNDLDRLQSGFIEFYISLCFENSSIDMNEKIKGLQGKIDELIKYENITEKSIVKLSLYLYEIYCWKSYWTYMGTAN